MLKGQNTRLKKPLASAFLVQIAITGHIASGGRIAAPPDFSRVLLVLLFYYYLNLFEHILPNLLLDVGWHSLGLATGKDIFHHLVGQRHLLPDVMTLHPSTFRCCLVNPDDGILDFLASHF